jgi:Holliday junction resolvase RusA-like endonuclease
MGQRCAFVIPGKPSAWKRTNDFIHPTTGKLVKVTDAGQRVAQANIARIARLNWKGDPATGPVILRVVGIFAIPPSWPKKLQQAAREARVMHVSDPDLDQLVKQVKDALRGIVYVDDNQVCGYPNTAKRYGEPERTEITIEVLDQAEDERTPGQRRLEAKPPEEWLISGTVANKLKRNRSKTGRPRYSDFNEFGRKP